MVQRGYPSSLVGVGSLVEVAPVALLAEGLGALDLRGLTVSEIARICDSDGSLEAVQLVFVDRRSLTLTVWTDWKLVAELRSEAVVPDYLWPPGERIRVPLEEFADSDIAINEVVPRLSDVGELVEVRFMLDGQQLLVGSTGGDLIVELE